jgi:hypothetical protein
VLSALLAASCVAMNACFPGRIEVPWRPSVFDARRLEGEWFVAATNFPMWLAGDRCDPRFRYARIADVDGNPAMDDEVSYVAPGATERETIDGVDVQNQDNPARFTWRGDGVLALFTSEWFVAYASPTGELAIIYFTATPATPAGVDVVTRAPVVSPELVATAEQVIAHDAFLQENARGLVWLGSKDARVPAACRRR